MEKAITVFTMTRLHSTKVPNQASAEFFFHKSQIRQNKKPTYFSAAKCKRFTVYHIENIKTSGANEVAPDDAAHCDTPRLGRPCLQIQLFMYCA